MSDPKPLRFRAELRCMASSEIAELIPEAKLAEIKKTDPHPKFKAFVVGHEGEARGHIIGVGGVVKRWFKDAIEKLYEKIKAGLRLFHGHNEDNSTEGREAIGEVVGKALRQIEGRLTTIAAVYLYPEFSHLPLDVASVEIDFEFVNNPDGTIRVMDVREVTGIALGNSAIEKPAFPGATLLGTLQAFEAETKIGYEAPLRLGFRVNKNGQPPELRLG